jgi:hypothetical protein
MGHLRVACAATFCPTEPEREVLCGRSRVCVLAMASGITQSPVRDSRSPSHLLEFIDDFRHHDC